VSAPGRVALLAAVAGAAALACSNAGADRVLAIQSAGVVKASVFFDRNGNRTLDAGVDTTLTGVGVRLIFQGAKDTVARGVSDNGGAIRFTGVPVGSYVVDVDTTTFGADSFAVTRIDTAVFTLGPGDSTTVRVFVSYPEATVRQARALPAGKRRFVVGVALNRDTIFGDSTVHLVDTSGAIRMTAAQTQVFAAGDSVRVLGRSAAAGGQPTLAAVTLAQRFITGAASANVARSLSTLLAANADTGRADAALVKVQNATIQDTATVSSPAGRPARRLHVNDGSGILEIQFPDSTAGFKSVCLAADTVGAKVAVTGVLVPAGSGVWSLKPRSPGDVVPKPAGCP